MGDQRGHELPGQRYDTAGVEQDGAVPRMRRTGEEETLVERESEQSEGR